MRGERTVAVMIRSAPYGSSPHARGTLLYLGNSLAEYRGIPACTGNASPTAGTSWTSSVHPRIRGERGYWRISAEKSGGSSPHMRGTPRHAPVHGLHLRFIPACAGDVPHSYPIPAPAAVHPRMRGERCLLTEQFTQTNGSSPHARGTQRVCRGHHVPGRFIPACAGNASMDRTNWPVSPVHPRMCGERTYGVSLMAARNGSSPHVRGTLSRLPEETDEGRFIPACAGNASSPQLMTQWPPVHPRMCGERFCARELSALNTGSSPHVRGTPMAIVVGAEFSAVHPRMCGERLWISKSLPFFFGSSPHVRGTLLKRQPRPHPMRFIPACAGNAGRLPALGQSHAVHPRMCGERVVPGGNHDMLSGSSPHVRGTLLKRQPRPHPVRFIPACAGNAAWVQCSSSGTSVHPRMCGERVELADTEPVKVGSSPHVRGTPLAANRQAGSIRFIPACAGNARWRHSLASRPSVHPRMRGERAAPCPCRSSRAGSSPHARGTHGRVLVSDPQRRFIPACAGNAEIHT